VLSPSSLFSRRGGRRTRRFLGTQGLNDFSGQFVPDPRLPVLLDGGVFHPFDGAEVTEKLALPLFSHTGDVIQTGADHRLPPHLPVEGDGKAVNLLLYALDQVKLLAPAVKAHLPGGIPRQQAGALMPFIIYQTADGNKHTQLVL